ncbi:MAG: GAF domain-containing protein [Actinobacteria bacterium]|nr:MAG: GAF domain-containing protein [Actinomycetota bacterium]
MVQLVRRKKDEEAGTEAAAPVTSTVDAPSIPIPDDDPLAWHLLSVAAPVELAKVPVASPAVDQLRAAGIEIVVPLVGQGELMGALYLGPRLSDQPYSSDDRKLLASLAGQVAPAMRVAQLVQEQQAEAKERERIQQEMRVAALIQQTLLPKELPEISGWTIDAFYRPARAVGGDFYDFIPLADGRLGVVIGDVTDKGVPAALVMATCRSMLRAAAQRHTEPGAVLADVNDSLVAEIPPAMFVTCCYAIVDTDGGEVVFANAGHNLPYVRTGDGVIELRATGMPLGLMPGMGYDEKRHQLAVGEVMVLTSDGITEAHNPEGEMYGFGRLMARVAASSMPGKTVSGLISDLEAFTGASAEQEDDITLVVVRRTSSARDSAQVFAGSPNGSDELLASFTVASVDGNERLAIDRVVEALAGIELPTAKFERLKTAVGETVMNAIEHGNQGRQDLPVGVEVLADAERVTVRVTDQGGGPPIGAAETPDLEAKLAGEQTPRGWGLFLIEQMVDEMRATSDDRHHTVELVVTREGGQ